MNRISTYMHGILDYTTAALLFALPYLFGWGPTVTWIFMGAAVLLLGLSLLTRYELSVMKLIPMVGHLTMDFLLGAALLIAAWVIAGEEMSATLAMMGIGLMEIGVALMTERESSYRSLTA
ncbi:MAG: hypothetical protein KY468_13950 [Armatimonadetes bacterium]|nr:hypothetical protein [Armatimonadota bacterium]